MDVLGKPGADLSATFNEIALIFLYIAIATLFTSFFEVGFWMWTGNRQTNRIRQQYLAALLRQDISYYDVDATTGLPGCLAASL